MAILDPIIVIEQMGPPDWPATYFWLRGEKEGVPGGLKAWPPQQFSLVYHLFSPSGFAEEKAVRKQESQLSLLQWCEVSYEKEACAEVLSCAALDKAPNLSVSSSLFSGANGITPENCKDQIRELWRRVWPAGKQERVLLPQTSTPTSPSSRGCIGRYPTLRRATMPLWQDPMPFDDGSDVLVLWSGSGLSAHPGSLASPCEH